MLEQEHIKFVQNSLGLVADGIVGPMTEQMMQMVDFLPTSWPMERRMVGYIQYKCNEAGYDAGPVDGYWGPQTDSAWDAYVNGVTTWRDDEGAGGIVDADGWPLQTQTELIKYYGDVGTNQTKVVVPYPHKIAWAPEKTITKITCHEKVADSYIRVLTKVLEHYGQDEIERLHLDMWGGCLNVRKMRGGTKYSTHSWGIAHDYDPANNKLRWKKERALFAKSDYDMWWKFWEEEGWVSLGRTKNYDWMHVQAARVKV